MNASKRHNTPCLIGPWRLLILSLMLGGGIATTAAAQTPGVPTVEAGKPFKVAFDHDGVNVTSFRVLLNGTQVAEVPASSRVGGVVTVDMPPLPAGAYSVIAVARNDPGTPFTSAVETASVPYAFEVWAKAPAPNPPKWRGTFSILADGTLRIDSLIAEQDTLRLLSDGTARVER